ncbi:MAG TPA: hypothetical protein VFE14_20955 [Micromonosporaceae bacterium]|jgi:hypothetical protein|nr:hypothetical protein [Micromonosporaceae bacterium]
MRKILVYSAVLIGTYLVVANATGAGKVIAAAGTAASGYAKTLQGR